MSGIKIKRVPRNRTTIAILPSDLIRIKGYQTKDESLTITLNRLLDQLESKGVV